MWTSLGHWKWIIGDGAVGLQNLEKIINDDIRAMAAVNVDIIEITDPKRSTVMDTCDEYQRRGGYQYCRKDSRW